MGKKDKGYMSLYYGQAAATITVVPNLYQYLNISDTEHPTDTMQNGLVLVYQFPDTQTR